VFAQVKLSHPWEESRSQERKGFSLPVMGIIIHDGGIILPYSPINIHFPFYGDFPLLDNGRNHV